MLNLSFYITLLLLSLNQLVSVSKSEGMNIYLFDIAIALFSFLGVVYFALVKKSLKIPKNSFLFGIFSVFAIASLVFSFSTLEIPAEDFVVSAFYLFRFFSYLLSGVVVFNMMDKKLITKEKIFKVLLSIRKFLVHRKYCWDWWKIPNSAPLWHLVWEEFIPRFSMILF